MTITYVGAGTTVTGNNTNLTPIQHASTAVGDLVIVFASIRNSGTGSVDIPTGWWRLSEGLTNAVVMGRLWEAGDVMPTVTFAAGAAGADTIAQTITFRGVEPRLFDAVGARAEQLNVSAQNVNYPALDVPGANLAVVIAVWKQDDSSAVSIPAGFTSAAYDSTTTGDDATQAIRYQIQTTETDIIAGALTVTGGASAISRSFVLALRPAAAIAITEQDAYPPRVQVAVTGLTVGHDEVEVVRRVAGVDTTLRGGVSDSPVVDPSFLVVDAELPFGVPVKYTAIVNGTVRYDSASVTYTLTGGKVALSDAITGNSVETQILAWPAKSRDRQASVFQVGARNVVVMGDLGQFESDITIYFDTDTANDQFRELLEQATEGVLQIRQPGGYAGVDSFVAVTTAAEERHSQDGTDPQRRWTLHVVEVDGWAPTLEATGFTLADIDAFYAGGTLADLAGDHATLLDIARADWS